MRYWVNIKYHINCNCFSLMGLFGLDYCGFWNLGSDLQSLSLSVSIPVLSLSFVPSQKHRLKLIPPIVVLFLTSVGKSRLTRVVVGSSITSIEMLVFFDLRRILDLLELSSKRGSRRSTFESCHPVGLKSKY